MEKNISERKSQSRPSFFFPLFSDSNYAVDRLNAGPRFMEGASNQILGTRLICLEGNSLTLTFFDVCQKRICFLCLENWRCPADKAPWPLPPLLSDPLTKVRATTATAAQKIPPILLGHHCLNYRKIDLNKTPACFAMVSHKLSFKVFLSRLACEKEWTTITKAEKKSKHFAESQWTTRKTVGLIGISWSNKV